MAHTTEVYHLWSEFSNPASPAHGWDNMIQHILSSKNKTIIVLAAEEWDLQDFQEPRLKQNPELIKQLISQAERHCEINSVTVHIVSGRYSNWRPGQSDCPITEKVDSPWHSFNTHLWGTFWFYLGILRYKDPQNASIRHLYDNSQVPSRPHFVCYINRPHPYRCYLMDQFAKTGIISDNLISFLMMPAEMGVRYQFKHWQPQQLAIPGEQTIANNYEQISNFQWCSESPQYRDTLFDVVPESGVASEFITEKTVLPILKCRPFVVVGCAGFHQRLADLGFELFPELFDYGFDTLSDSRQRIDNIVAQLQHINTWSSDRVAEVYHQLRPACERNVRRLFELVQSGEGIPGILEQQQSVIRSVNSTVDLNYYTHIEYVREMASHNLDIIQELGFC